MVGGKQGYVPCKILFPPTKPLFVSDEFHGDHKVEVNLVTLGSGDIIGFEAVVSDKR